MDSLQCQIKWTAILWGKDIQKENRRPVLSIARSSHNAGSLWGEELLLYHSFAAFAAGVPEMLRRFLMSPHCSHQDLRAAIAFCFSIDKSIARNSWGCLHLRFLLKDEDPSSCRNRKCSTIWIHLAVTLQCGADMHQQALIARCGNNLQCHFHHIAKYYKVSRIRSSF